MWRSVRGAVSLELALTMRISVYLISVWTAATF